MRYWRNIVKKVREDFNRVKDNDLLAQALGICKSMEKNPYFKNPIPSLKSICTATQEYEKSLSTISDNPTRLDFLSKKTKRLEIQTLLNRLAKYVNLLSNGDLYMLESSGFKLTKAYKNIGILNAPAYIHVRESQKAGEVQVEIAKVPKALGYIVSFKKDTEQNYQSSLLTSTRGCITNLESGIKYVFKVTATSSASAKLNNYNFSDSVSRFIQ